MPHVIAVIEQQLSRCHAEHGQRAAATGDDQVHQRRMPLLVFVLLILLASPSVITPGVPLAGNCDAIVM